jgi:hypothetical protein
MIGGAPFHVGGLRSVVATGKIRCNGALRASKSRASAVTDRRYSAQTISLLQKSVGLIRSA